MEFVNIGRQDVNCEYSEVSKHLYSFTCSTKHYNTCVHKCVLRQHLMGNEVCTICSIIHVALNSHYLKDNIHSHVTEPKKVKLENTNLSKVFLKTPCLQWSVDNISSEAAEGSNGDRVSTNEDCYGIVTLEENNGSEVVTESNGEKVSTKEDGDHDRIVILEENNGSEVVTEESNGEKVSTKEDCYGIVTLEENNDSEVVTEESNGDNIDTESEENGKKVAMEEENINHCEIATVVENVHDSPRLEEEVDETEVTFKRAKRKRKKKKKVKVEEETWYENLPAALKAPCLNSVQNSDILRKNLVNMLSFWFGYIGFPRIRSNFREVRPKNRKHVSSQYEWVLCKKDKLSMVVLVIPICASSDSRLLLHQSYVLVFNEKEKVLSAYIHKDFDINVPSSSLVPSKEWITDVVLPELKMRAETKNSNSTSKSLDDVGE